MKSRQQDRLGENSITDIIRGDRRASRRYDVGLELRYRIITANGSGRLGFGTARNLSRGGVLVQTDEPLPTGLQVELCVKWPYQLQNVCPLDLVIIGHTVRLDGARTAVRSASYSFHTRGARFFDEDAGESKRLLAIA
jgi:PilZ domain